MGVDPASVAVESTAAADAASKGAESAAALAPAAADTAAVAAPAAAGADVAAAGAPLDLLAGGTAAGTAAPLAVGATADIGGALASGLATEPGLAGSVAGSFAPGLDTTAAGLAAGTAGGAAPAVSTPGASSAGIGAGGGASAAGSALPFAPEGTTTSDLFSIPTESASGAPISATATDPTTVAGFGTSGAGNLPVATDAFGSFDTGTGAAIGDTTTATLGTPGAASAGGGGNALTNLLTGAGNWAKANPLTLGAIGLEGANVAKQLISGNKLPYQSEQEQAAANAAANASALNSEAQQFLQPSLTGQLPPQLEAQVQNALKDAISTTQARYATLGLSNSTMVSDQIAYLQSQAEAMRGTLAQQLATTGTQLISQATSDLSMESNIYSSLMNAQISQDNALSTSVAQFAGSLAIASVLGNKTTTAKAA